MRSTIDRLCALDMTPLDRGDVRIGDGMRVTILKVVIGQSKLEKKLKGGKLVHE